MIFQQVVLEIVEAKDEFKLISQQVYTFNLQIYKSDLDIRLNTVPQPRPKRYHAATSVSEGDLMKFPHLTVLISITNKISMYKIGRAHV